MELNKYFEKVAYSSLVKAAYQLEKEATADMLELEPGLRDKILVALASSPALRAGLAGLGGSGLGVLANYLSGGKIPGGYLGAGLGGGALGAGVGYVEDELLRKILQV